ncbi:DUF6798 domain-containing protein [Pseudotenacibaculum sp. MALMAid0570]|uniref:DUF6798 domain-containing protein n=1 Tax=Pseudotenacibaculum sp. MALMAid0570 TaxID=3143938 RepID=UPI0032E01F97
MILSKSKLTDYIFVSTFFGILTTLLNYSFGNGDHLEQLPIIYKFYDSNYLVNDFFVTSNSNFSPRYYYANLIAFLASFINIPTLFFFGTLFSNISVSILTFLCGEHLFNSKKSGIIAAAMIMTIPTLYMGSSAVLYASMFTPTTLGFPLLLLSFYFLLKKKIIYSLLITGCISIFHILIGFEFGMLFLITYLLADYTDKKSWISIVKKASFGLIILVFLLPNIVPHFQNNQTIENNLFIEILANFRHPHHYVLSDILAKKELLRLVIFLITFYFIYRFWRKNSGNSYHKVSISFIILSLFLCILFNWIFVELIPVKLFTSLQLLRLLDIGKWLFILLLANYIFKEWKRQTIHFSIVILGSIVLVTISSLSLIKMLFITLIFFAIIYLLFKRKRTALMLFSFIAISLVLITNNLEYDSLKNYQKTYFKSAYLTNHQKNISTYIQKNTDSQSIFLVPYNFGFLRTESKRAIVTDFKAFPFQETAMLEWYNRIKNCYGLNKKEFTKRYKEIYDEHILNLKELYEFDYAILHKETITKFPVIYSDLEYKIIDLNSYAQ